MEESAPKTGVIFPPSQVDGGDSIAATFATIGRVINAVCEHLVSAWEKGERDYNRGARLRALQRRRQWKKADRPRLLALGVSSQLIERHVGTKRLGRPVVNQHKPLAHALESIFLAVLALDDRRTKPHERLSILKRLPMWWPYFVEALYRGERESAKARRLRSPSIEAEVIVGKALNMSPEAIHKVCGDVRRGRKKGTALPDCRAMTVAEFEMWKRTGKLPKDLISEQVGTISRLA
ncbi:MAG: hypothetical protein P4L80_01525 [Xanthobacteraceae bacterium]|nr:hypothetical protein [Xanthobacteraceae bacterium]